MTDSKTDPMTAPEPGPFADIRNLLTAMPGPDAEAKAAVAARDATLTKPAGSLGRLESLVTWLAAWQGKAPPTFDRPLVCVFAGSHGVTRRGVSAFPDAVNRQMLDNFAAGGGAINQICAAYGLGFKVFDLALDMPTGDITEAPALDERATVATMAFGMEAVAAGTDCLGIGEMGIGNTTVAAALYAALFGGDPAHWVGRGTGVDRDGLSRKVAAVEAALAHHAGHLDDPLISTDPDELRAQLAAVRHDGIAHESGESTPDVSCAAAPVRDDFGRVVAAISVAVPDSRWQQQPRAYWDEVVRRGAASLSRLLGYAERPGDRC